MIMRIKSMDEAKWRAESDAHTLAEYEAIMNDAKRKSAAIKVARTQAAELTKRANLMSKVGGTTKAKGKK